MDFLTFFPYWGILIIIILNALIVRLMSVEIRDDPKTDSDDSLPD